MKFRSLIALVVISALFSCSKEFSITQPVNGIFTAEVNGVPWLASTQQVAIKDSAINIIGVAADGRSISIKLKGDTVGTYYSSQAFYKKDSVLNLLSYRSDSIAYTSMAADTTKYSMATIKVTKIDKIYKTISGTFEARVFRRSDSTTKLISAGIFTGLPYSSTVAVDTSIIPIPKGDTTKTPVNPINPIGASFIKADINGNTFTFNSSAMTIAIKWNTVTGDSTIVVVAMQSSKLMYLNLPSGIKVGTYSMNDPTYEFNYAEMSTTDNDYGTENGTLVITKNDQTNKVIEGTFIFDAVSIIGSPTKHLTNGQFSVRYKK